MSNLLLITDVARLRKVFGGLTDDKNIRLRIANNLEKGGEEIAIEKPDVVFVQTHLSGLSADILIMHLKKQLGRKRSSFVLLAAPNQVNEVILAPYKGWLDTSSENNQLLDDLHNLVASLTTRKRKNREIITPKISAVDLPELPIDAAPTITDIQTTIDNAPAQSLLEVISAPVAEATPELSLEEQGITYSPRPRLTVHSEFNSSFDNAVSSAPAPEFINETSPNLQREWNTEHLVSSDNSSPRSKRSTFILWLAPVIIAVVVTTFLQQRKSSITPDPVVTVSPTTKAQKPQQQTLPAEVPKPAAETDKKVSQALATIPDYGMSDKTVMSSIVENNAKKDSSVTASTTVPPSTLPDFIPRYGFDKQFSAANPGWERYKGKVTEFKVYRESQIIKAIQVIDRGGGGVPESFMKGVMKQVAKKPVLTVETTEKKDGYEIQRGRVADNLKAVYYRDAKGGKLRAFVISWQ